MAGAKAGAVSLGAPAAFAVTVAVPTSKVGVDIIAHVAGNRTRNLDPCWSRAPEVESVKLDARAMIEARLRLPRREGTLAWPACCGRWSRQMRWRWRSRSVWTANAAQNGHERRTAQRARGPGCNELGARYVNRHMIVLAVMPQTPLTPCIQCLEKLALIYMLARAVLLICSAVSACRSRRLQCHCLVALCNKWACG